MSPLNPQNVPEFERSNSSILAVNPATDSAVSTRPESPVILVRTHPAHKRERTLVFSLCRNERLNGPGSWLLYICGGLEPNAIDELRFFLAKIGGEKRAQDKKRTLR